MNFHWSDSGLSQVFKILLADLYNATLSIVSICLSISNSPSLLFKPLKPLLSAPIKTGITFTFIFCNFFYFSC